MEDIINEKLDNMVEIKDRTILKAIVKDVFAGVVNYQQDFNKRLEDRIFNQIEDKEKNYDIYTTIVKREELKIINDFLLPILKEDQISYSQSEILDRIREEEKLSIAKVFLKIPYEEIEELKEKDRAFNAQVITEDDVYNLTLKLKYNDKYIKAEEKLYNIFLENNIGWRTVNNPYIRKIFDIVVVDADDVLKEVTEFEKIKYNLEEFKERSYLDHVPVWNIKKIEQKGEGFPVPAEDKVNYDHYISIDNLNPDNGYLVIPDGYNIASVKKQKEQIIITSDKSNSNSWELLKIIQDSREKDRDFEFPLLSNSKKDAFLNKFIKSRLNNIRTKAELNRIINSYQDISEIKLVDVEILEEKIVGDTYDYNIFIKDEIRATNQKKLMLLKFIGEFNSYLKDDFLSFLVSEIQMYFPEYECKGVILK